MRALVLASVVGGVIGFLGHNARASFLEIATETASGVTISGSGSINVTGASFEGSGASVGALEPSDAYVSTGGGGSFYDVSGPSSFGSGGYYPMSGTGDNVGIGDTGRLLIVPTGYISNTMLTNSLTFSGATFASLGLTVGTFVYSLGSPTADTFIFQVGSTGVPEPATFALLGAGLAGACFARRRSEA